MTIAETATDYRLALGSVPVVSCGSLLGGTFGRMVGWRMAGVRTRVSGLLGAGFGVLSALIAGYSLSRADEKEKHRQQEGGEAEATGASLLETNTHTNKV